MKVRNKDINRIGQALALLSKQKLSTKLSWFISSIRKQLLHYAETYQEERFKIIQEYGDPIGSGEVGFLLGTEKGKEGRDKLKELDSLEFEFPNGLHKSMLDEQFKDKVPEGYADIIFGLDPILVYEEVEDA